VGNKVRPYAYDTIEYVGERFPSKIELCVWYAYSVFRGPVLRGPKILRY